MRVTRPAPGILIGVTPASSRTREELRQDGRAALTALVAELCCVDARDVVIEARCPRCGLPHGRPVVTAPGGATDIGVSITHAEGTTIAAAAQSRSVGVDAEPWRLPAARAAAIPAIAGVAPDDVEPVRHWTRVEAVLKADGRGLDADPGLIRFEALREDESARVVATLADRDDRYTLLDVDTGSDLYGTGLCDTDLCVTAAIGRARPDQSSRGILGNGRR